VAGQFLFDSVALYNDSSTFEVSSLYLSRPDPAATGGLITSVGLTNALVLLEGRLAFALLPQAPFLAVALINYLLVVIAFRTARRAGRSAGLNVSTSVEVVILMNPFVWMNMVSLTKEIWGLVFISGFALACVRKKLGLLVVLAFGALLVREWYVGVAVGMALVAFWHVRPFTFLLATSLVVGALGLLLGVSDVTGVPDTRSLDLGQRSAAIMAAMGRLQDLPLGHLVAFPVILLIDLSAWVNPNNYTAPLNSWYIHANTASSLLFTLALAVALIRFYRNPLERPVRGKLLGLLFVYAVLVTLNPISQHRYLLPAWPLLAVAAFSSVTNATQRVSPLGPQGRRRRKLWPHWAGST
jgi:hypothetical protein